MLLQYRNPSMFYNNYTYVYEPIYNYTKGKALLAIIARLSRNLDNWQPCKEGE